MWLIREWLEHIGWGRCEIEVASSDASFRSYYRVVHDERSYIVMDSSRQKESLIPFLDMQQRLLAVGVRAPKVFEQDLNRGYLILEDFGQAHLLDTLSQNNQEKYYKKAIDQIILMQKSDIHCLPLYDKDFLLFEMNLCGEWYLEKHLGISLDEERKSKLNEILALIADEVLMQPNGLFVHRDFHSRNIMIDRHDALGIIDFQDARAGAITYDLVSLLKDCYYEIDKEQREAWALYFRDNAGIQAEDETFLRWFDMMGLQRHIKVLGIFARLNIRDGKEGYLKDIPLTLKYVLESAAKYPHIQSLCEILG